MHAVRRALQARGIRTARIRIERFAASIPRTAPKAHPTPEPGHAQCDVTAIIDGATRSFTMEKDVESVLDAGLRAGIDMRYSCKGGVCSTCRARSSTARSTWTSTTRSRTTRSRAASC